MARRPMSPGATVSRSVSRSPLRAGALLGLVVVLALAVVPAGPAAGRDKGDGKTVALAVQRVGPPRYVRASDGRTHVDYNLMLTNSFVGDVTLKRLQIKSGG